jgi:hypothetical protein
MARIAALLLLLTSGLYAQRIDGTLTDSITHAPIPNVIVTLLGQTRYNGTSDEIGVFHIDDVKPGKYFLNIVKSGYVLPRARLAGFQVDSDMRLSIEMDPLGRVEGRVRYSDGRPAPRAALSLSSAEGHNYTATADLNGSFLIEDVVPGTYVLRAVGPSWGPHADDEIWAATYFPSTVDRAAAEPIPVMTGIVVNRDVRLRSVPARHIRGIVRDETGQPAEGVTVRLNGGEDQTVVTAADGAFEFLTRDGDWRLTATRKEGRGQAFVNVARHDLENVQLRLALPFSVPLIVDRDGAPETRIPPVILLSVDLSANPRMEPLNGDNILNVYPGRYNVQTMLTPPGSYLESIKYGEMDVTNQPFDLWSGAQPIRVSFRRGAAMIRGTLENSVGDVVVLEAGQSQPTVHVVSKGSFNIGGLRPGDYYVFAVEPHPPLRLTDAILQKLLRGVDKIHLDKGGSVTLNLKAIPWPE